MKKTPGKAVINSVNKPIEHNPPGKDASNRIARVLGKAADMAGSNKVRKVSCISIDVAFQNLPCLVETIVISLESQKHLVSSLHTQSYFCRDILQCSHTMS